MNADGIRHSDFGIPTRRLIVLIIMLLIVPLNVG